MIKYVSAEEAVKVIESGDRVFIHGGAATPTTLIKAMTARAGEIREIETIHLHTEGPAPFAEPGMEPFFRDNSMFMAGNVRKAVNEGRADNMSIFLVDCPTLFRRGILPLDVAMVHVSPPDKHGYVTLGVSVDVARAAVQTARKVIAQVNPNMPRTHGDGFIHYSKFDALVLVNDPIHEHHNDEKSDVTDLIGAHIAGIVEDGATLQMGIGAIPDAVLGKLMNHKDLGIHTEMFSDGMVPLVEKGIVTNMRKKTHPGKIVAGFAMGTRRLYDFMDDNPLIAMCDIAYVNDTAVIRKNPKVTAINSAIEVDLTGQVCSDSIGTRMYSGVGGQVDFIRGASLSEGGKPIIALPSTTSRGDSKIVNTLKVGAGVVTNRAQAHYIATEYGIAELFGKNNRLRAQELIKIAHPDHREGLDKAAFERFGKSLF
ncbi:MAG: acetyl-CoA hydrolase/transferase family protein [Bacteroidetes bacterium]|nr:acetyl-CoA hydrolase/transferase family protein [Bacteroidota bacterium]